MEALREDVAEVEAAVDRLLRLASAPAQAGVAVEAASKTTVVVAEVVVEAVTFVAGAAAAAGVAIMAEVAAEGVISAEQGVAVAVVVGAAEAPVADLQRSSLLGPPRRLISESQKWHR